MDGLCLLAQELNIRVYDGLDGWMDELATRGIDPVSAAAVRAGRLID
jgi:hypothetical protein